MADDLCESEKACVCNLYFSASALLCDVIALIPLSVEHSGCCWINDCEEIAQQD